MLAAVRALGYVANKSIEKMSRIVNRLIKDFLSLGIRPGGVLLVHSSLKSLGWIHGGAETIIQGLLLTLGNNGTLLMPALSFKNVTKQNPLFHIKYTPSCIGNIPETFRLRVSTVRSLHPTHSVCASGPLTEELLKDHRLDVSPCGPNSPFQKLPYYDGQILMLGCGLTPNTSIHAVEEKFGVPYLLSSPMVYKLINQKQETIRKEYYPHNFRGWEQRYDRIQNFLNHPYLRSGNILEAQAFLIEAKTLWNKSLSAIKDNPYFFVEEVTYK